ncbi:MAG: hypothetical protein P8Y80_18045 [Acidobacteriota bacterium]|jgi:hypothetical protein
MSAIRHFHTFIFVLFLCSGVFSCLAQTPADAVPQVPELDSFHEVIFKIWHEAWPNKDTAMLKALQPEVEEGISRVAAATLPGILREKRQAWEEGVEKLLLAGSAYKAASDTEDAALLLETAEELHSRFETLMRLIRPVLRELDDFHASLYMLYHYYLPEYDIENIRTSARELKQKMQALDSAVLPERLQSRDKQFRDARQKLSESVEAFHSIADTGSEESIKKAIEELHTDYQTVQKIFE